MSRPKKRVLLYCAGEDMLGRFGYLLSVRGGYNVTIFADYVVLGYDLANASPGIFDAAVVIGFGRELELAMQVVRAIKRADPGIRCLLLHNLAEPSGIWSRSLADIAVNASSGVAELLERLRTLTARKRGRRPVVRPAREVAA